MHQKKPMTKVLTNEQIILRDLQRSAFIQVTGIMTYAKIMRPYNSSSMKILDLKIIGINNFTDNNLAFVGFIDKALINISPANDL
jgi:hypothetical protein